MSETIRIAKSCHYTQIHNSLLEDSSISWQAKGLLCYLLSRKSGWTISSRHLATVSKGGIDQVQRTLRELQAARYIYREQVRDDRGRLRDWVSWIYESPEDNDHEVKVSTENGKPDRGKPDRGKPDRINTDRLKTELSKDLDRAIEQKPIAQTSETLDPEHPQSLETAKPEIHPLVANSISGGGEFSGGCRTTESTSVANIIKTQPIASKTQDIWGNQRQIVRQKKLAQEKSWLEIGIENGRWRDLEQSQEFAKYARKWVENRPEQLKRSDGGVKDVNKYLSALIERTAKCDREDSPDLLCWHAWLSEPNHVRIAQQQSLPDFRSDLASSEHCLDAIARVRAQRADRLKQQIERNSSVLRNDN